MASLTQKATRLGGAPRLSIPPAGELEFRSQPSSPSSDYVDINLGDLEDFPFGQDHHSSTSDDATGSLSQDVLSQDVGVDLGASPRQQSPEQDRAASTPIVGPAALSSAASSSSAVSPTKGKDDDLFLKPGLPVRPRRSKASLTTSSSIGKSGTTSSDPTNKRKKDGASVVPPNPGKSDSTSSVIAPGFHEKDIDAGGRMTRDESNFFRAGPPNWTGACRPPTDEEWARMDDLAFVMMNHLNRMPLATLNGNGVINEDSIAFKTMLCATFEGFVARYNAHLERYQELQGDVKPNEMFLVPGSGSSIVSSQAGSSASPSMTIDMGCQTDGSWSTVIGSESRTMSSALDDADDSNLDSDDLEILRQFKAKQVSPAMGKDVPSPKVGMPAGSSAMDPTSDQDGQSTRGAAMDTDEHVTGGSTHAVEVNSLLLEANGMLGVLGKAYASRVQEKLRNRSEFYKAQEGSEESLNLYRRSSKRPAEQALDLAMDGIESEINDTLELCQALEESLDFDVGAIVKRRKLGWTQRRSFGCRSSW